MPEFFEPLILYLVLFFPGITAAAPPSGNVAAFSAIGQMLRLFTYSIPALGLIWYLVLEKKSFFVQRPIKPQKKDLFSFIPGFFGLILIGAGITFLISRFSPSTVPPVIEPPSDIPGWIVMFFSCLGTGYLEESFFRFYLLQKLKDWIPLLPLRVLFSVLLFAFCHGYEGPWGVVNAVLAGLLLSVLFEKYKTLHGIAWAHALYNVFVYITGAI
ncbi:MAG: CPBP family intramembrane metalloprotease [Treponema sp.]|nr:CPBP family intramembrane metalloprotease [Treponema sp.]